MGAPTPARAAEARQRAGHLGVLAGTAYQSYLPSLVPRERLVEANGSLEASRSLAPVAGPSLGVGLVQLVTAPVVILVDALSFLASAVLLLAIRTPEPAPTPRARDATLKSEIVEGLRVVLAHRILRTVAIGTAIGGFFDSMLTAVFVLYLTHELGLQPTTIGLLFAASGGGALLGAALVGRVTNRLGIGHAVALAATALGLGYAAIPLAVEVPAASVGALLGGTLAGLIGLHAAVTIVALAVQVAVTWILSRPSGCSSRNPGTHRAHADRSA